MAGVAVGIVDVDTDADVVFELEWFPNSSYIFPVEESNLTF